MARDIDVGPGVGGGDATEAFAYDALGRLTEATDDDSTVQFTYDSLSRTLTEVQGANPLGAEAKTVSYAWDEEGNRTFVGYPSGFEAHEHRDALGRIDRIDDDSEVQVAAFKLFGAGLRPEKVTLPNGGYATTSYDGFRRPTSIVHKDSGDSQFAGFAYAWDKNDNPLMEKRSHRSGKGDVYSYDKANRLVRVLTDVDDPEAELATPNSETYVAKLDYNMDDVFNLTSYVVTPYGDDPVTTSYTTDALNQYTEIGAATLTYTDAGSLADDGARTYTYDAHQHLIAVHEGETLIASYAYDALGLGRRTSKTVSGTTTRYIYAGQQSVEEYEDGDLARLFVFGERIDQVVMMEAPDSADLDEDEDTDEIIRLSYHTQLIGSVTHVTGPTGSLAEQYEYDPYGAPTVRNGAGDPLSASAIRNPYLYTGRQLDEETGLYYYRARQYSAELRRFIQRDPLEYVDGPNASTYVRCMAAVAIDPSGLAGPHIHDKLTRSVLQGWGASDQGAADAAAGNNAVDGPDYSRDEWAPLHSQRSTESGINEDEARKLRDKWANDWLETARERARAGDFQNAYWALGGVMHMYQDEVFHAWNDQDREHPGLQQALGALVSTISEARPDRLLAITWGLLKDLFGVWLVAEARAKSLKILTEFEKGLDDETIRRLRAYGRGPVTPSEPSPVARSDSDFEFSSGYWGGGGAKSLYSVNGEKPAQPHAAFASGKMDFERFDVFGHTTVAIHPGRAARVGLRSLN